MRQAMAARTVRADAHCRVKQALSLTIPRRQIGRWQWQDFIEVGEAAIGVETKGTIKYAVTFRSRLINIRNQHICKIKRIAKFNLEFVCAFLAAQPYSGM